jgi:putative membrane protein
MDVMHGESVVWKGNPSWKGLLLYYVKWTVISLLPAALWVLLDRTMDSPPSATIFSAVTLLGLVLTFSVGWIKRTTTKYTITDQRIHIRAGIVSRHEHSTQLGRIQNVNISQTIFQRMLGIGDVDWDTAGTETSGADFRLYSVDDPSSIVRVVDQALQSIQ